MARNETTKTAISESSKTPYRFTSPRQPKTTYLLIPIVSSENRRYIPVGYVSKDIITNNANFTISNASLYTLGVLTSSVHMAWMRTVAGRLKSDYRYSNTIVYNNFIWPKVTEKNKSQIEKTAQMILDARAKHPTMSLAQLYDELTMPEDLRNAHTANDKAVMKAYGFKPSMTEPEIVAELFKLYEVKLKELEQEEKKKEEKSKATEKSRSGKAN
ncbi:MULTISPECIES: type IIL restriction-modification enzyme MmeI [Parasutterella]